MDLVVYVTFTDDSGFRRLLMRFTWESLDISGNPAQCDQREVRLGMSRLSIDDVHEHSSGVCFKNGPPGTVGAETEWLVVDHRDPGAHVSPDRLRALLEPAVPLPASSGITYEP